MGILATKNCFPSVNCKIKQIFICCKSPGPLETVKTEKTRSRERQYLKNKSENEKISIRMEMSYFRRKKK